MRVCEHKGRSTGGATDGGGGDWLVPGEDAAPHGAQVGGVQTGITVDVDWEGSEECGAGDKKKYSLFPTSRWFVANIAWYHRCNEYFLGR